MLEYTLENERYAQGYAAVCGVDEAGRGPWCGSVFAAACILPVGLVIEGLNDSKSSHPKSAISSLTSFARTQLHIALLRQVWKKLTNSTS